MTVPLRAVIAPSIMRCVPTWRRRILPMKRDMHISSSIPRPLTTYLSRRHPVTDPLGLQEGALLPDDMFPPVDEMR